MTRGIHIGLNYTGSPYELTGCAADARAVKQLAQAAQSSYDLTQFEEYTGKFGAERMFDRILSAAALLRPSDTLYISFSGHGTQIPTANGPKEALCLWNGTEIEIVLDSDFRALLSGLPCTVIAVLDSCYSGGMSRTSAGKARRFIPFDVATMPIFNPGFSRAATSAIGNRVYFLMACEADEVAYESKGMGEFTRALVQVVKGSTVRQKTVKNIVTKTRHIVPVVQNPIWECIGGNAGKRVF